MPHYVPAWRRGGERNNRGGGVRATGRQGCASFGTSPWKPPLTGERATARNSLTLGCTSRTSDSRGLTQQHEEQRAEQRGHGDQQREPDALPHLSRTPGSTGSARRGGSASWRGRRWQPAGLHAEGASRGEERSTAADTRGTAVRWLARG